jgi:hypothetical protein
MGGVCGARRTRSVRVSTYPDNEGTLEAFTFLRFVHASTSE